jgi:hypothetical protein
VIRAESSHWRTRNALESIPQTPRNTLVTIPEVVNEWNSDNTVETTSTEVPVNEN